MYCAERQEDNDVTDQELLKCYTDFVPFLAAVCGPGCEIVIHNVTNPEQSIIAIGNGTSHFPAGCSDPQRANLPAEPRG